jgi:hypothetical protein
VTVVGARFLLALAAISQLAGCQLVTALTFQTEPESFQPRADRSTVKPKVEVKAEFRTPDPRKAQTFAWDAFCNGVDQAEDVKTASAALPVGVLNVLATELSDQINSYLAKLKESFTRSYQVAGTFREFPGNEISCIVVERRIDGKIAMQLVLAVDKDDLSSRVKLRPIYLNLRKSAARTGIGKGLDLLVHVELTTVRLATDATTKEKKWIAEQILNEDLNLLGMRFETKKPNSGNFKEIRASGGITNQLADAIGPSSPWNQPLPSGPVYARIKVTETGSGAPDFDVAKSDYAANQKVVVDTLTALIKGAK